MITFAVWEIYTEAESTYADFQKLKENSKILEKQKNPLGIHLHLNTQNSLPFHHFFKNAEGI